MFLANLNRRSPFALIDMYRVDTGCVDTAGAESRFPVDRTSGSALQWWHNMACFFVVRSVRGVGSYSMQMRRRRLSPT